MRGWVMFLMLVVFQISLKLLNTFTVFWRLNLSMRLLVVGVMSLLRVATHPSRKITRILPRGTNTQAKSQNAHMS